MLPFPWLSDAPPLPVALPLFIAALLAALNRRIPVAAANVLAVLTTAAVGYISAALLVNPHGAGPFVYWFSGWSIHGGQAIGIAFAIDRAGAALATLASLLMLAALVFSSRYFDTVGTLYHSLMLVFLAAMAGFCLTGDLFNLFVFFELMSAAAFALCGYKSEEAGPLQGALNFAVTNAVGAYLVLSGIGLAYGRTGALNLAQIGRRLAAGPPDALAITAFTLIACGFLVKAAVAPFHFWLADAHTVAPAPVSALFSGIMVELGLYAVVRVYWTMFSGVFAAHDAGLRNLLTTFGTLTAVGGALMCYAQRHLKRLLAFSTISHIGVMLLGVAMLTPSALGGAGIYALSHGLLKAGLFLTAGIVLHRTTTVDELQLRRSRQRIRWTGLLMIAGAAGLAHAPPFGTFRGEALMSASAARLGYGWLKWISFLAAMITAGAILRFAAGALLCWGRPSQYGAQIPERPDTDQGHRHTPMFMWVPAVALIVLGLWTGLSPSLEHGAVRAAASLENRVAYAARVLDNAAPTSVPAPDPPATPGDFGRGLAAFAGAVLLAFVSLWPHAGREVHEIWRAAIAPLRDLHSGIIPDYIAWLLFGTAVFGCAAMLWIR